MDLWVRVRVLLPFVCLSEESCWRWVSVSSGLSDREYIIQKTLQVNDQMSCQKIPYRIQNSAKKQGCAETDCRSVNRFDWAIGTTFRNLHPAACVYFLVVSELIQDNAKNNRKRASCHHAHRMPCEREDQDRKKDLHSSDASFFFQTIVYLKLYYHTTLVVCNV